MSKLLLVLSLFSAFALLSRQAKAQEDQILNNGQPSDPAHFKGAECLYHWTNNALGIGLPESGTGDIASFTAVNTSSKPIIATITATPVASGYAYICHYYEGTVSVVNLSTNSITTTIPVGINPSRTYVSPDGTSVYVSDYGTTNIFVISTTTNAVVATIDAGVKPGNVVVSPDGGRLYVSGTESGSVLVIDVATKVILATITVGSSPQGIAFNPDGTRAYVVNNSSGTVSVINTASFDVIGTIPVGYNPVNAVVSPDGSRVYVTNGNHTNTSFEGSVSVINAIDNTVIETIITGSHPYGIAISPDGSRVYQSNNGGADISVINTATNKVIATIATPVVGSPTGVCLSPEGNWLYAINFVTGTISVINTATNIITAEIPVGSFPLALGNFINGIVNCNEKAVTFTITVNPTLPPTITAGAISGTISSCSGSASANPNVQQFAVSASKLAGNLTVAAPDNFEISISPGAGFAGSIALSAVNGTVDNTLVYVRSSSTAPAGTISGDIILASTGATNQMVGVTGSIIPVPAIDPVTMERIKAGDKTTAIHFTGTGATYNWVNNTPGIGLPASGTGDIPSFVAINNSNSAITATFTVTPMGVNSTCNGAAIQFTMEISPTLPAPNISTSGTIMLNTTYGSASAAPSFSVSGINLTEGISLISPADFELSTDNINFNNNLSVGSAANTTNMLVYVRLKPASFAGNYSGSIVLSSTGAATINLAVSGMVIPAPLTITVDNATKKYGNILAGASGSAAFKLSGVKNGETVGTISLGYSAGAAGTDAAGTYSGAIIGSAAKGGTFSPNNYIISYVPGNLIISQATLTVIADSQRKPYGTANPVLTATYQGFMNNETVSQLIMLPELRTTAGTNSPDGTYPIIVTGGASLNYTILPVNGELVIYSSITIANTFTPNGDGINDTWTINALANYPHSTVCIFNRYGDLVYRARGYPKPWDGTYNGKQLAAGTYYFLIDLQNGTGPLSGPVTIIR
ncbi:MBG domain-containing protein [Mucilaginibacter sp.]|uniref:MBG domain-containing protein n=1 Tax=Mucilaginibacter sp. TaxID=1882438 RepID=UPI0032662F85